MTGAKVPLILDTDAGSDCEDMAAVKAACVLHRMGLVDLLGFSVNTSNTWAGAAVDAERKYMGLPQLPLGVLKGVTLDPAGSGAFTQYLYNNFPHDVGLASTCPNAVTTYRTLLAARTKPDVVIVSVGFMTVLAQLLASPADGISPLTGTQLVAASVAKVVQEAGQFPQGADGWNLTHDAASANYVMANMPSSVTVEFQGDKVGLNINDLAAASMPLADPCRAAYVQWGASSGRGSSWDQMALQYAVEGPTNAWQRFQGTIDVNATTGYTTWTANPSGSHYYVVKAKPDAYYAARVRDVLAVDTANAATLSWTSEAFTTAALS